MADDAISSSSASSQMIPGEVQETHHYSEPSALGLTADVWVALSMVVIIVIMLWMKVPSMIARSLDSSIGEIRKQLDDAKALRVEAEALRKEYAEKMANAERDAEDMIKHARAEAEALVVQAQKDAAALVARREQMAETKIAAAERNAIDSLKARTADAAVLAAHSLIKSRYDSDADKGLIDRAISDIQQTA